jgi:hypothetical protein
MPSSTTALVFKLAHASVVQIWPSLHCESAVQQVRVPPVHAPLLHRSFEVQASPSSHGLVFGAPPWQIPETHVSPLVQTLPSSQAAPSSPMGWEQTPPLQTSRVHGLLSLQFIAV